MRLRDATRGWGATARAVAREADAVREDALARLLRAQASAGAGFWALLCVVPGREFAVVERLEARSVFAFTPVEGVWRRKPRGGRKRLDAVPAAPGYVLARLDDLGRGLRRWVSVYACEDVVRVVEANGAPVQLRPVHVVQAAEMWRCGEAAAVRPAVGQRVRVIAGAGEGLCGTVAAVGKDAAEVAFDKMRAAVRARVRLDALQVAG